MGKRIEGDWIGTEIRSETTEGTGIEEKRENGKKTKIMIRKETEKGEKTGIGREAEIGKGEKDMKMGTRKDLEKKNGIMTRIRTGQKEEKKKQVKEAEMQKGLRKEALWMLKDQKKGIVLEIDGKKRKVEIKIVIETKEEKERMRRLEIRIEAVKEEREMVNMTEVETGEKRKVVRAETENEEEIKKGKR